MPINIPLIKQKIHVVFTNIHAYLLYIYNYLNETKYWYPLCDLDE